MTTFSWSWASWHHGQEIDDGSPLGADFRQISLRFEFSWRFA